MVVKTVGFLFLVMIAGLAILLLVASARWNGVSDDVRAQLMARSRADPGTVSFGAAFDSLPGPVQRYLRTVLREGRPVISRVRVEEEGTFLTRPERDVWGAFSAMHDIVSQPAGFLWDARISMGPGITVRVRDAFVDGAGSMFGSIHGVIRVVNMADSPELSVAALQRWLAESVWIPTALLPENGVRWTALTDSSARASVTSGPTTASLDFFFDAGTGLVTRVYSASRGRAVNGAMEPTPWEGRWFDWSERDGVTVPGAGEVAWLLPAGPQAYWRGRVAAYTVPAEAVRPAGARR